MEKRSMLPIFIINFLLAISTTIGMTIIPFLITDSLGLSLLMLGIIEGVSEFLSNSFRLVNGILFDKIKNKRMIFVTSTGIAFLSKTMLLLPSSIGVLFSKVLERIANGTFASPRDAFVAGNARNKGMALGLLGVSKTIGCVLGPLIVSACAYYWGNLKDNLHLMVFICCSLAFPAFLLSFTLKVNQIEDKRFSLGEVSSVFKKISPILFISFLFFLARFNDGLIMIYLKNHHFPEWFYLATIGIFNTIMLITSPIIGRQIDKGSLIKLIHFSCLALIFFNVCFYQINFYEITTFGWIFAISGLVGWGIQRASAQIVFSAFVFTSVEKQHYGTAIGIYYILSGVASLIAACLCGYFANSNILSILYWSSGFALLAILSTLYFFSKFRWPIPSEAY